MKHLYFFFFISIIFFLSIPDLSTAQSGDSFVTNINTPSNGMIVYDIAYSSSSNTDKVFVYSLKKLLTFTGDNASNKTIINFGGSDDEYGQYQFPFNAFDSIAVQKMMAIDNTNGYLYVVTPNLNLIRIDVNTQQKDPNFFIPCPTATKFAGENIIRFDNIHHRLYWAYYIKGQNGFHFGVYQANGLNLTLINSFNDFYSQSDPAFQIFDIASNETNNIFYLSRNGSYEVWEIVGNSLVLRKTISIGIFDRTGKLIYVHKQDVHKVFCLPFGTTYAPATVFVIDGDDYNQVAQFSVPYRKVRSGIFDESNNNLILGFLMDGHGNPDYDIAVYNYNNNTYNLLQTLNTGTPEIDNSPVFISKKQNNFIISKNDELVLLSNTGDPNQPYSAQTLTTAKTNFFTRSVVTIDNYAYILKNVSSGVETINPDNSIGTDINTGSTGYNCAFSNNSQKAYFFTRQHFDKSHINIVDTHNNSVVSSLLSDKPVGDVVFNPYTNEFIVIENKDENTSFKVYNATTNSLVGEYNTYMQNCEKMFIAPNNRLYITGNMLPNNNDIEIKVYNATTYEDIAYLSFNYTTTLNAGYVRADFAYNYNNNCVYGVFHTFYAGFSPAASTPENSDGDLVKITDNNTISTFTTGMNSPEKIICDNSISVIENGPNANYDGSCFIKMWGGTTVVFDCHNETITNAGTYSDITYNPFTNVMYGVNYGTFGNIYTIDKNGINTEIYSSTNLSQCRSINYNRYNNRLYMYVVKSNNSPETNLYSIDPANISAGMESTYLHNRSVDVLGDNDFYFHNDLTFDPYSNQVFIPNGTHGNISVVSFVPDEPLLIRDKLTWLSIPRIKGNGNGGTWPTSDVLNKNKFETPYNTLYEEYYDAQTEDDGQNPYVATYNINLLNDWSFEYDLSDTRSTRGYKLTLNPDNNNLLYMQGNVADPSTPISLYCNKENWIGYFLYERQNILDALGSAIDNIYLIQHQDYTCYRYHYPVSNNCNTKSTTDYPPGTWICDGKPIIKYGDMVIVKPDENVTNFQWYRPQLLSAAMERPTPTYYVYDTTADYSTIVIELDTTQTNPVEIGAVVNDTCVGATSVLSTDSVVVLRAYLQGQPQDSVTFEEHYASRSVENKKVSDYYVLNAESYKPVKKTVKVGERKDFYIVSFRNKKPTKSTLPDFSFNVYPNPAHSKLQYHYVLPYASTVSITIYNIEGKQLASFMNKKMKTGVYTGIWSLENLLGKKPPKGPYIFKIITNKETMVKKVIIQ